MTGPCADSRHREKPVRRTNSPQPPQCCSRTAHTSQPATAMACCNMMVIAGHGPCRRTRHSRCGIVVVARSRFAMAILLSVSAVARLLVPCRALAVVLVLGPWSWSPFCGGRDVLSGHGHTAAARSRPHGRPSWCDYPSTRSCCCCCCPAFRTWPRRLLPTAVSRVVARPRDSDSAGAAPYPPVHCCNCHC
jgi:hypothetical protein